MNKSEKAGIGRTAGFWLIVLLPELFSFFAFAAYAAGLSMWLLATALIMHLVSAAMFFFPGFLSARYSDAVGGYERHLYGWLTLFIPYLGVTGSVLVAVSKKMWISADSVSLYKEMTHRERFKELYLRPVDDIKSIVHQQLDVQPIKDILEGDDAALKTGAISLLARKDTPEAVQMLQKCLSDDSDEVRYFAHLALLAIEERYTEKIQEAQEKSSQKRGDRINSLKVLGGHYLAYANSGLVDEKTHLYCLERAQEALSAAFRESREKDAEASLMLGNIALMIKDYPGAISYFRHAMNDEQKSLDAKLGLWRAYFEQGDMISLAAAVGEAKPVDDYRTGDMEKIVLYEFWTKRGAVKQ